jgi:hypothetical protein
MARMWFLSRRAAPTNALEQRIVRLRLGALDDLRTHVFSPNQATLAFDTRMSFDAGELVVLDVNVLEKPIALLRARVSVSLPERRPLFTCIRQDRSGLGYLLATSGQEPLRVRSRIRLPTSYLADLTIAAGTALPVRGRVVDLSSVAARIELPVTLTPGTAVRLAVLDYDRLQLPRHLLGYITCTRGTAVVVRFVEDAQRSWARLRWTLRRWLERGRLALT